MAINSNLFQKIKLTWLTVGTNIKPKVNCDQCGKEYSSKQSLKTHNCKARKNNDEELSVIEETET